MAQTGGDELEAVKDYFNTTGYDRWKKIYGETDDVNKVGSLQRGVGAHVPPANSHPPRQLQLPPPHARFVWRPTILK